MSPLHDSSFYALSGLVLDECVPNQLCPELMTGFSLASCESSKTSFDTHMPAYGAAHGPELAVLDCVRWPPSPSSSNGGQARYSNLSMDYSCHKSDLYKSLLSTPEEKDCLPHQAIARFKTPPSESYASDPTSQRESVPQGDLLDDSTSELASSGNPFSLASDLLSSSPSYWHGDSSLRDTSLVSGLRQMDFEAIGFSGKHEPETYSIRPARFISESVLPSVALQYTEEVCHRPSDVNQLHRSEKRSQAVSKRVRRQRKSREKLPVVHLRGTHQCQFIDPSGNRCRSKFQRQEHFQRHSRTHLPAYPFRCQLSEFIGDHNCGRRMKRSDNRDQHHFTHGKGGFDENASGGRNVHVEPEVLIQALKKTSFCDDDGCNAKGPCKNPDHLAQVAKKQPSRIRSQMKRLTKGCTEPGYKRRVTKRIANIHVEHEQMKRLGFPQCLHELETLQCSVDAADSAHKYFTYAQKWHPDEQGELQNWRYDEHGCLFVMDIDEDGSKHERCLCGPLHTI